MILEQFKFLDLLGIRRLMVKFDAQVIALFELRNRALAALRKCVTDLERPAVSIIDGQHFRLGFE